MVLFDSILILFTIAYSAQVLLFIYGVVKARYPIRNDYEPAVSIVIAARNEAGNIGRCLESIVHLEYPTDKLEVIIVDDTSTDGTTEIIRDFQSSHSLLKSIVAQPSSSGLRGKANAIAQGIDISCGEIIMMTDADCAVPPLWVRGTVRLFRNETGIVAGLTLLRIRNWFHGMQSLDWAYLLAVASATMHLKKPLTCIGNNFSFRRKAYDEVGGYRGINFSVTEDFALFTAIIETGRWDYCYPITADTLVTSEPCYTAGELYRQKRRWGVGGKDMRLSGMMIMVVGFVLHSLLIFGPFIPISWIPYCTCFAIKMIIDFSLLSVPLLKTEQLQQLKYFPAFEIYYIFYVILLPFAVFLGGDVVWKGRRF
jgi:1,2-diacylglycerol 3-beta-glucosyltransferase